jgi:hypothetical protein
LNPRSCSRIFFPDATKPPIFRVTQLKGKCSSKRNEFFGGPGPAKEIATGVEKQKLAALLAGQTRLSADSHPHPRIQRLLEASRKDGAR